MHTLTIRTWREYFSFRLALTSGPVIIHTMEWGTADHAAHQALQTLRHMRLDEGARYPREVMHIGVFEVLKRDMYAHSWTVIEHVARDLPRGMRWVSRWRTMDDKGRCQWFDTLTSARAHCVRSMREGVGAMHIDRRCDSISRGIRFLCWSSYTKVSE